MTSLDLTGPAVEQCITGQSEAHIIDSAPLSCRLHREVEAPLLMLREKARAAGFDLAVASGFRGFDRQRVIWNEKVAGKRPVLDDADCPLDLAALGEWEQIQAILRWSALPGASRHHWGTDVDVYDRAALNDAYPAPQLTAAECCDGGIFGPFHHWLDQILLTDPALGFFRPYDRDRGGIGPEPWHISYRPLADKFQRMLTREVLARCVREGGIALAPAILDHLDEIYQRFVLVASR